MVGSAVLVQDHAHRAVVQHLPVDRDGGLAAVVDDPVVPDDVLHPAAVEVHVDEQLGCAFCREDRNPRLRADGALRPDVDLAVALDNDARRFTRAAEYRLVHPVYRRFERGWRWWRGRGWRRSAAVWESDLSRRTPDPCLGEVSRREIPVGGSRGRLRTPALRVRAVDRDSLRPHRDVPHPVGGHGVGNDAVRAVMQRHVVDYNGGLAAVVQDPVVAEGLRHHLVAVEVHVDAELGRERVTDDDGRVACREDRDPGLRADGALRPDDDPAAAREINARRLARAAEDPAVHRDCLLAIAFIIQIRTSRDLFTSYEADFDAVRIHPTSGYVSPDIN